MFHSHKRILDLLKAGGKISTLVSGRVRNPVVHNDRGDILMRPRMKTLDEMVRVGLIHHYVAYVGDGTSCDEFWHLGEGGDVVERFCSKCEYKDCPVCHPCFKEDTK